MTIQSLKNSPLVEMIAEIHWPYSGPPIAAVPVFSQPGMPQPVLTDGLHESLFSELAQSVASMGFVMFERLVPPGFPTMPDQPACRFKGHDPSKLLQAGLGMFSVNALPPYKSWEDFRPVLRSALEVFFSVIREKPFPPLSRLSLRYVNLFDPSLSEGLDAGQFAERIAGIKLMLPAPIEELRSDDRKFNLNLQFGVDLDWGGQLGIHLADAIVGGRAGVLLDSKLSVSNNVPNDLDGVMRNFEHAHDVVHQSFFALASSLLPRMEPQEV